MSWAISIYKNDVPVIVFLAYHFLLVFSRFIF